MSLWLTCCSTPGRRRACSGQANACDTEFCRSITSCGAVVNMGRLGGAIVPLNTPDQATAVSQSAHLPAEQVRRRGPVGRREPNLSSGRSRGSGQWAVLCSHPDCTWLYFVHYPLLKNRALDHFRSYGRYLQDELEILELFGFRGTYHR